MNNICLYGDIIEYKLSIFIICMKPTVAAALITASNLPSFFLKNKLTLS